MKALRYTGPFELTYTDVPDPEPGPEEVLVRVQAVGICGSDVQGYTGTTGRRLPPLIMGHEAAGIVEHVGAQAKGVRPGDRVCFDSTIYCNACPACRRQQVNRCERREVLGVSVPGMKREGAMAELVRVPWWVIVPMPPSLSFIQAALLEPAAIGLHAVNRGAVAPGETVVIVGAGPIGLCILLAARLQGAGQIIVSDRQPYRLAVARALGADLTVQPGAESLAERVVEATGGRGAEVCFEAVGLAGTLHDAVAAAGVGGRVVLVGNLTKAAPLDVQLVTSRELTLRGTYASSGEYRTCVGLVAAGRLDVLPLVSERLPLAAGPAAFERLHRGEEELLKIVLLPAANHEQPV